MNIQHIIKEETNKISLLSEIYKFYIEPNDELDSEFHFGTLYDIKMDNDSYGVILQSNNNKDMTYPGKTFYIKFISLDDDAKKMGAFYSVMKYLEKYTHDNKYEYIELEINTSYGEENYNKLQQLFKMYGFNVNTKKKNNYATSLIKKL